MTKEEFKAKFEKVPVEEYPNTVPQNVMVSICVQTYQHANYIEKCLDSLLMQKTNFNFEILLGEDASSDGTRNICITYAKKYPNKIKLFLHKRENNIYILNKPSGRFNFIYNLLSARSKYIAFCEGDDYWTDPFKIQKQFDFLESHNNYVACGCYIDVMRNGNIEKRSPPYKLIISDYLELIDNLAFPTLTLFFRNIDFTDFINSSPIIGDIELFMYLSQYGNFVKLPFNGGVYRYHGKGANSGNSYYTNKLTQIRAKLNFYRKFDIYTNQHIKNHIINNIKSEIKKIFTLKISNRNELKEVFSIILYYWKLYRKLE